MAMQAADDAKQEDKTAEAEESKDIIKDMQQTMRESKGRYQNLRARSEFDTTTANQQTDINVNTLQSESIAEPSDSNS